MANDLDPITPIQPSFNAPAPVIPTTNPADASAQTAPTVASAQTAPAGTTQDAAKPAIPDSASHGAPAPVDTAVSSQDASVPKTLVRAIVTAASTPAVEASQPAAQARGNDPRPLAPIPVRPLSRTARSAGQGVPLRRPAVRRMTHAQERAIDEAVALRSLDDTTSRPLPDPALSWESEPSWRNEREGSRHWLHIPTIALVGIVAVVAFVAGGIVSRMSAQVPLLFPQTEQEEQQTTQRAEDPVLPVAQEEPEQTEPTERQPDQTTEQPSPTTTPEEDTSWRWEFDDQGDRSVSYDPETDTVTLDYDGYEVTVDLDYLLGETPSDTPSGQRPDDPLRYERDYGTGYDEEERDPYVWIWRDGYGTNPWAGDYSA